MLRARCAAGTTFVLHFLHALVSYDAKHGYLTNDSDGNILGLRKVHTSCSRSKEAMQASSSAGTELSVNYSLEFKYDRIG